MTMQAGTLFISVLASILDSRLRGNDVLKTGFLPARE